MFHIPIRETFGQIFSIDVKTVEEIGFPIPSFFVDSDGKKIRKLQEIDAMRFKYLANFPKNWFHLGDKVD